MDDQAKQVYETIIAFLEKKGCSYYRYDEKCSVIVDEHTDDGTPYMIHACVEMHCPRVTLMTPFSSFPEEKFVDMAVAVSMTNYLLADGRIDISLQSGNLLYSIAHYCGDSGISEKSVDYLFMMSRHTTNKYYTRFSDFADGKIDIYQLMEDNDD